MSAMPFLAALALLGLTSATGGSLADDAAARIEQVHCAPSAPAAAARIERALNDPERAATIRAVVVALRAIERARGLQ